LIGTLQGKNANNLIHFALAGVTSP
jgi:hypothetical protein